MTTKVIFIEWDTEEGNVSQNTLEALLWASEATSVVPAMVVIGAHQIYDSYSPASIQGALDEAGIKFDDYHIVVADPGDIDRMLSDCNILFTHTKTMEMDREVQC